MVQIALKYKEFVAVAGETALTREEEAVSLPYFQKPTRSF